MNVPLPEIQVCGSTLETGKNADNWKDISSMPIASSQKGKTEVVCFGSTKIQDAKANEDEGKSAQEDGRKSAREI